MPSSLITSTPIWFIAFCLLAGAVYAFLLYRKDSKFAETSKLILKLMFGLRFLSVSIISFLLLSPMLKTISKTIEKPIIIFAQDNSESIASDTTTKSTYSSQIANFRSKLESKFDVQTFKFGEKTAKADSFNFKDKFTDISEFLNETENRFIGRNVGAIIMASDGIYNKGENPTYVSKEISFPVYTIATGDSEVKKDIILSGIKHNRTAYLNNKFPLQAIIVAKKMNGSVTEAQVFDGDGKLLISEKVEIDSEDYYHKIDFEIEATKKGVHRYFIKLINVDGETELKNNSKTIAIEVIDSKQKILILADGPHPDISALQQALILNKNFETEYYSISDFKKGVKEYNLVILHQLPSISNSATSVLKEITTEQIPVLYILGLRSDTKKFDNLNTGLQVKQRNRSFDEAQGIYKENFDLFKLNEGMSEFVKNAPPLISPFGKYSVSAKAEILFQRAIKQINTGQPLFIINPNSSGNTSKSAVVAGEGIWRWRIFDYQQNENHYIFNELVNKTVQYLTIQMSKERFRVMAKTILQENEEPTFTAEVYNKSYELINSGEVNLSITDSSKNKLEFVMNKTKNSYDFNPGILPAGEYDWQASTQIDGKTVLKNGKFTITPINIESENTVANHKVLNQVSQNSGGKMFTPTNLDSLLASIEENKNVVPVSFSEKKTENLLNLKWIFFAILLLLSIEWFMRKYNGGY